MEETERGEAPIGERGRGIANFLMVQVKFFGRVSSFLYTPRQFIPKRGTLDMSYADMLYIIGTHARTHQNGLF